MQRKYSTEVGYIPGFVFTLILVLLSDAMAHAGRTGVMGQPVENFKDQYAPATVICPNNTYLAGFAAQYARSFSGLQPYCANMAPDGAWLDSAQISLDRSLTNPIQGGSRVNVFCPLDFYVFGFSGYSAAYGTHSIVQMNITCKNVKTGALLPMQTLDDSASKTEWRGDQCRNDEVANGVFGLHHSGTLAQFGLSCERTRPAVLLDAKLKAPAPPLAQQLPPSILAPLNGQRFLNQTVVPIKLAPPPTWSVSMYTVNIQRKDNSGNWVNHVSLPVGPAQAHSPNGYTEFGAGGKDGRSLAYLISPGAWRLSAQISAPKPSNWSNWQEFHVQAPPTSSKALKPGRLR